MNEISSTCLQQYVTWPGLVILIGFLGLAALILYQFRDLWGSNLNEKVGDWEVCENLCATCRETRPHWSIREERGHKHICLICGYEFHTGLRTIA